MFHHSTLRMTCVVIGGYPKSVHVTVTSFPVAREDSLSRSEFTVMVYSIPEAGREFRE